MPVTVRPQRHVIIGGGVAGLTAAQVIRRRDTRGQITIVTEERHLPYSRPGLAYLLAGDVPLSQLFPWTEAELRALQASFLRGRAMALDMAGRVVVLQDGRRLAYDALLLATGATAVLPDIPGTQLRGVATLDQLDDATRILALARRGRRAVVVGGGITAVELAEGLAARGVETHYLLRKDRYWGQVLDPEESRMVERGLERHGIRLHYHTNVVRVLGQQGRVKGVLTEKGKSMACDLVGFAIGIRPKAELAASAGLDVDRGIRTDEYLRTSAEGVYAAGDAAEVYDPATGKHLLDSLWWMAQDQGRVAGDNMSGGSSAYLRDIPFNVTRIGGLITTIVGNVGQGGRGDDDTVSIVHGQSEGWHEPHDSFAVESGDLTSRVRLLVGRETLVGAVIMGDQTLSRPLCDLVRQRVPLGRLRQQLLQSPERAVQILVEYSRRQADRQLQEVA
ncbi:MAG TPA: FAD-dependent oxidoreductase [Anaerolineales bacterium]|nr:FAD-dependent oxidoreductase [Anaerolineales bacterium]